MLTLAARILLLLLVLPPTVLVHSLCFIPATKSCRYTTTALFVNTTPITTSTTSSLGLPQHLHDLPVGGVYESEDLVIEKWSHHPPLFVVRRVLSPNDCKEIILQAREQTMMPAQTVSGSPLRLGSHVAWLDQDNSLARRMHSLFLPEYEFCDSHSVEPLQVVRYEVGGEYRLHHDGNLRLVTVLYNLLGVGATWFPLANHDTTCKPPQSRLEAITSCALFQPGQHGVLVTADSSDKPTAPSNCVCVQQGDAVVFYNYLEADGSCDWTSLHAGLPCCTREKWVANHWFRLVPFSKRIVL